MSHGLRYYDGIHGHYRFKRRYIWAACAFFCGVLLGLLSNLF
jgi:hypothetical protein